MTAPLPALAGPALAENAAADFVTARADALLRAFGSPLYVVSEPALRAAYRNFSGGFSAAGIAPRIAYSYKTNYLPAVCAILHQEGAAAEVVSGMEYSFARALGVLPRDIVFNGPGKTRAELEAALGDGALIVADNFDELDAIIGIAACFGAAQPLRIGLRIGLNSGGWSRFGFSRDSGDARRALEKVAGARGLRLETLHHHAGTDHRDPAPFARAAQALMQIRSEAESLGLGPATLDLGGGFPADLPLAPFAAAIAEGLGADRGKGVRIVVEPGRALVDPAAWLLCTVAAVKDMPGPNGAMGDAVSGAMGGAMERAVIVDAGINLLSPACRNAPRPVAAAGGKRGTAMPASIFGPLCMPDDRLAERVALPPLCPGDVLVIGEAGAYTLTQSTEFAAPRPAVVLLGPDGPEIVRRRETWRDVIEPCELPERLRARAAQRETA
jgi:diaminopimelate decarboxylase